MNKLILTKLLILVTIQSCSLKSKLSKIVNAVVIHLEVGVKWINILIRKIIQRMTKSVTLN